MKAIDICYTPLDVSKSPDYSIDDVKTWITENTETLQQLMLMSRTISLCV